MLADGTVHIPLDVAILRRALEACRAAGAESLAVSFLHAYANPELEEAAAKLAVQVVPGIPVTLSSLLSPQYREYERTNTAVVNAYITPKFRAYMDRLRGGLAERGFRRPLYLMQNIGGIATAEMAARFPVRSLDSGPAAGALMAAHLAGCGHPD
jgi:N-methylhydantoinase A/oxoprolinase/acetone carboxylase beta subunit